MTDTIPYPCHLSTTGTEKTVNHRPIRQSTANPYLIPIPVNASDNDDGDEGDEEHVNMAMALLQKLLDGVNIYLTFFNDNLAQDPGLQDTKNRYVLKKKSRQILLREVFKSNFENFLGRICLEIFFFSAYLFFGTLPTSQKKATLSSSITAS